jgi:hypothetical protein
MSRPEWLSVLKLAMLWQMENVKKIAVKHLLELPATTEDWLHILKTPFFRGVIEIREVVKHLKAVEKVVLGRECRKCGWLMSGYRELATRLKCISRREADQLGERAYSRLLDVSYDYFNGGLKLPYVDEVILEEFEEEFGDAGYIDGAGEFC